MANFVTDGSSLPTDKVGGPDISIPTDEQVTGTEYNTTNQAALDIRSFINLEVILQSYGADASGALDCSSALAAALAVIGASQARLVLSPGVYRLSSSPTIPANVSVVFESAMFSVDGGHTVNILGSVQAPVTAQIFSGAGTATLACGQISVKWFGAKGDASTNDAGAINKALAAANGSGVPGGIDGVLSNPVVFFPSATYLITASLTAGAYRSILGEKSTIYCASGSIDLLNVGTLRGTIRDMQFYGGQNAIVISTGNVDTDDIQIENCRFFQQSAASIKIDADSNSTLLLVKRCLFYNGNAGANVFYGITGDYVAFDDCWVTFGGTSGDVAFHNSGCFLFLSNILGVPGVTGVTWVKCDGGNLIADRIRFGGEAVDGVCVEWRTPPSLPRNVGVIDSTLTIKNSSMYTADENNTVKLYQMPNRFVFENNTGMHALTLGAYFDSGIPLEQRSGFSSDVFSTRYSDESNKVIDFTNSDPELTNLSIVFPPVNQKPVLVTDLVSQGNTDFTANLQGGTISDVNDPFGTNRITATVTPGGTLNFQLGYGSYNQNGTLPAGDYTLVWDVEVGGAPIAIDIAVGGSQNIIATEIGHNILSVPFSINAALVSPASWASGHAYSLNDVVIGNGGANIWRCSTAGTSAVSSDPDTLSGEMGNGAGLGYTNTDTNGVAWTWLTAQGIGVACYGGILNQSIGFGRWRIFKHHPNIKTVNSILVGSAAPVSGVWFAGDKVENSLVVPGGPLGWVCTTSGTPGTWVAFGASAGDDPGNISIIAYGADPTGAADSASAFTAAFTALSSGGILTIPAGTYKISSAVTCTSGIIIQGDGKSRSILSMSGAGQLILSGQNLTLRDLQVTSQSSPSVPSVSVANGASVIKIEGCYFTACAVGAIGSSGDLIDFILADCLFVGNCVASAVPVVSVGAGSSFLIRVDRCYFSNNSAIGSGQALTLASGGRISISRSFFESSGNAIDVGSQGGISIVECGFEDMNGSTGCIVANYTFGVGTLTIRDCFFSLYSGWSPNLPIITTNVGSVAITSSYFVGNPNGFAITNGITMAAIQGANLNQIVLSGNTCTDDAVFQTQLGSDADYVLGSTDSYTNLATHSSFEDASHVTASGGPVATQATSGGYLGNTAQQIAWLMGGSQLAQFLNTADPGTMVGDTYTVSFYARVTSGTPQPNNEPFQMFMSGATSADGYYAFNPTTTWKRFVFKSLPAVHTEEHWLYIGAPISGGGALSAITMLIDGLQVEKNVNRPHPLVTTTSSAITVVNSATAGS